MGDGPVRVRLAALGGLALWCAVVWYLSDQADPTGLLTLPIELPDYVLHFIEYAAGGALAATAFRDRDRADDVVNSLGFCAFYALLDEWHQGFVAGRDASGTDVAADVLGACAGACVAVLVGRARQSVGRSARIGNEPIQSDI